ncbi:MAG: conjugative transposon protein TraM [Terrimonas ferruginea]|uniref:conjugative transposon protein TraM n=1 Tax=Terrimonas ferruginea TaxID=249 RepID=UPI0009273AF4|nr:conjugative transposon protein TraM [Terrimonas ferruginea]MBN8785378.1 conjugative transposon protein TraM [Terrimonas ferruginea]MBX3242256.1 conjugative transposon protein TraM [Chitinophagaceae bacterium]MCW5928184.1 conjugative transposon protein TraM [Chitinophagaceae bacterium]OJW45715.1 MAG: conjugative transposon protein TraM [Sphingobacteriales bacterium 48-107]
MKDNESKRVSFLVDEDDQKTGTDAPKESAQKKAEKLKKPIIFILMGIVFLGCMYLIFKPSSDKKKVEDIGLNDAVPQATDAGLQSDKQKAYEQEMLEKKMQEKRDALTSLSDYWNSDSATDGEVEQPDEGFGEDTGYGDGKRKSGNPALNSYRNAQSTLSSFYQDDNYATQELRKQVEELKEQLAEKNVPPTSTVQDQLDLMEKSYEMASRYLPSGMNNPTQQGIVDSAGSVSAKATEREQFVAFTPARKNTISTLYREPTDSAFLASWNENRNRGFYTAGSNEQVVQPKNSIRAVVQETQTVIDRSGVRLRLLESAKTPNRTIPQGTMITANAKFQNGRLQLKVTSIEVGGNIIPVDITIYDLDGQQGLYVPYSPEMNALAEIASNMSQTSGTSIMMTRSAGQQAAGDLSRGVVQGIAGYFSKKVRTPKVTVKAGHQLFLVSKN